MGKFVFSLQSLYNVKCQMEETIKNKLGKAVQELEYQKNCLHRLEKSKAACIEELIEKSKMKVSTNIAKTYNTYISQLNAKISHQKENVKFAEINVDKVREQLIKVSQEKSMLEKLREKKYKEFLQENIRLEQKTMDEITSFKQSKVLLV